ncbi:MAG: hypothetical protein JWN07_3538, partial [Hyphomicrobiales bacterium]|nr:hypothetical protein [Hyphomicrobiales bacterium]
DVDEGLAILTERIVSEFGPREALAEGEARADAMRDRTSGYARLTRHEDATDVMSDAP